MKISALYSKTMVVLFSLLVSFALTSCSKSGDSNPASSEGSGKSSAKQILTFSFNTITPAAAGVIDQNNKTITVNVPADVYKNNLIPTITLSEKASINPASGIAQNFSNPVVYTVTAEDLTTVQYTVNVTGGISTTDPEHISGYMTENKILPNRNDGIDYIIEGELVIDGNALLTIEAGVKIAFTGSNGAITVNQNAGLKMVGTSTNPIILTGPVNNPNKGSWLGVTYLSNRADNSMEYVQMLNGGAWENDGVLMVNGTGRLSVSHCLISGSLGYGMVLRDDAKFNSFSSNTIQNCDKAPVWGNYIENILSLNNTSTFQNNGMNFIQVFASSIPAYDITINKASVPYYFEGGLYSNDKKITIQPGTTLLFNGTTEFIVNYSATLIAEGTETEKITFSATQKDAGWWKGLEISSTNPNKLSNCVIEYAGNSLALASLDVSYGKLSISNTQIKYSGEYGVCITGSSQISSSNVSFVNCAKGNVYNFDTGEVNSNF